MAKTKKATKKLSVRDYEKLGRTMESIFEGGYINHSRVYKINFIRGLFFGLGSVLGGTLIIALVAWVLSFFTELPIIGNFVETLRETVDQEVVQ